MKASVKAAALGEPSYVWGFGQERRLDLIRRYAPLEGNRILDVGCGIGTYVARLRELSPHVYGLDVDRQRVLRGSRRVPNLLVAASEALPFLDNLLDVVIFNEVLEHVRDERATLREALRVVKPGGKVVIYAPNRLFPFETHGVFLGRRYIFGNIPLVSYLPGILRRRLVPHARGYLRRDLAALQRGLPARLLAHRYVFPGFDKTASRSGPLAALLRRLCYTLEGTPLAIFGISHFLILEKDGPGQGRPKGPGPDRRGEG